ncbi:MAG TPA: hypothetical protein VH251_04475, partial [Verrucomicrobiae bacterium]|nr:hypothetical protein [Verrucomicrobiae bacterium]
QAEASLAWPLKLKLRPLYPFILRSALYTPHLTKPAVVLDYQRMKLQIKILGLVLVTALAGLATGCVDTVDGRSQAGVPFIKDTITGSYERSVPQVVAAAKTVLAFNGKLTGENTINNSLEAKVNGATVWVRVDQIDNIKPVSRVEVQVRNSAGGSNIDLAAELEKQIALQLAAH